MVMVAENQTKITRCSMQLPQMEAEGKTAPMKKFKITSKRILDASFEKNVKDVVDNGQRQRVVGGGSKRSELNVLAKASILVNSGKRKPEASLEGQRRKKQKMDCSLKIQLSKILKELISHSFGWVFSEPVDPVKLKIPDYWSIITKPMDLGTVLYKLEENMYSGPDEVAADVRLTFENAMSYNPPDHKVHCWAKTLNASFSRKWKMLEAKLKHDRMNDEEAGFSDCMGNNGRGIKKHNHSNMKPVKLGKIVINGCSLVNRTITKEHSSRCVLPLAASASNSQMTDTTGLRTSGSRGSASDISSERSADHNQSDDAKLVKLGKIVIKGRSLLNRTIGEEHSSQSALASAASANPTDSTYLRTGGSHCVASDISSESSAVHNHSDDAKLGCEVKYPFGSLTSGCSPDSDGPGVVVDETNTAHLSTPACLEGWTFNAPMSPNKALRAAMLKKRFADTIFKATRREVLDHSDKSDPLRMLQERERLEREQLEEKARIEALIKAAEAASRKRDQDDLKMRLDGERKAARTALEKIGKSVEMNDNIVIRKGLDMMGCGYLLYPTDRKGIAWDGIYQGNPLDQLGLHHKDDDLLEDEDDPIVNIEEGEILS